MQFSLQTLEKKNGGKFYFFKLTGPETDISFIRISIYDLFYEIWYVLLNELYGLMVFENEVLSLLLGPKVLRKQHTGGGEGIAQ